MKRVQVSSYAVSIFIGGRASDIEDQCRTYCDEVGLCVIASAPRELREAVQEPDPYWDYDESDCANCGGEGFVYGCSWDWQCDTYDEGEGTCLCTRPCDWCQPRKPDPALQAVLAAALAPTLPTEDTTDGR